MDCTSTHAAYGQTGFFSKIILDYLSGEAPLQPFYRHPVSVDGIKAAIKERRKYPTDRKLLVEELQKHYQALNVSEKVKTNINLNSNDYIMIPCARYDLNV